MHHRVVEMPAFKVFGKALRVSTKNGENFQRIPRFWEECMQDGTVLQLSALTVKDGVLGDAVVGICTDVTANMEEFTYTIGAELTGTLVSAGMSETSVPALTWAVFKAIGPPPEVIQGVMKHIWGEFFTTSEYKYAPGPTIEVYPCSDGTRPDYHFEVWVPVTRK